MAATATHTPPTFRTIQGWTIPLECPNEKTLRSWGRPKLTACAVLHPVAAEVLAEKDAADAAYQAECAEREAAKAAKAATVRGKHGTPPSTGNEPSAVDTAKASSTPTTTVHLTTLATATVAQLVAELVSRHATDDALDALGNMVGDAIDAARTTLAKPDAKATTPPTPTAKATTLPVAPPAKVDTPTVKPAGSSKAVLTWADGTPMVTGPAPKDDATPAAMAAQTAKVDAPKATQEKAAPKGKPTCKGKKADGTPCKSTICGKDGLCKSHQPKAEAAPTAKPTAPKVKPAAKAAPSDPILPGVFDAAGRPMTVAQVMAALDAYTAPAKKAA